MKATSILMAGLLTAAAFGAEATKPGSEASAAFDRLKTLAGQWDGADGKAHLRYEVISGGNALMERESGEGMGDMLTVYYLDGDRLLLTHYCMAGNEPRMQARHFDASKGDIQFDFLDASNLTTPNAGHMHDVKIHLADNDHLSAVWEFYENGKPKFAETAQYTRVR